MILSAILAIIIVVLAIMLVVAVVGLGAGLVIVFGDLIVFVLIVRAIIKFIKKRRKG